jgi:hypothetical protein
MATKVAYCTIYDLRSLYIGGQMPADDVLLGQMIGQATREINDLTNRWFYPRILPAQLYSRPDGSDLPILLEYDLLELTTLTNGDGTVLTAGTDYYLSPANSTPKNQIGLYQSSGKCWRSTTQGNDLQNISLVGVWGYNTDYSSAWLDDGITLSGSAASGATTITASSALYSGQLLKVDAEYLYVTSPTAGSVAVTVARGVNGSTSGSHAQGVSVLTWDFGEIGALARQCAAAYYRLRANPVGETVQIDGQSFATPKDVRAYMRKALDFMGLSRVAFG